MIHYDHDNNNDGIGNIHDREKELLGELLPRLEREACLDMHKEPSQEAVDREITCLKSLENQRRVR